MIDRPSMCPGCMSKFPDVRGQIFPVGSIAGYRCQHDWHNGERPDPNKWELTWLDKQFLKELAISSSE